MSPQVLLVDAGNSYIKWNRCTLNSPELLQSSDAFPSSADGFNSHCQLHWQNLPEIKYAVISNVAGPAVALKLQSWLQSKWQANVHFVLPGKKFSDLTNGYQTPQQLGADRWAALIAATNYPKGVTYCVVDCGTAVTIDILDSQGQHRGGLIGLGRQGIIRQLTIATADLNVDVDEPVAVFAKNTSQAITSGALYSEVGFISTVALETERIMGQTKILLTGGGALEVQPLLPVNTMFDKDLVMHGLARLAQDRFRTTP